jgi:hypothetical protein
LYFTFLRQYTADVLTPDDKRVEGCLSIVFNLAIKSKGIEQVNGFGAELLCGQI